MENPTLNSPENALEAAATEDLDVLMERQAMQYYMSKQILERLYDTPSIDLKAVWKECFGNEDYPRVVQLASGKIQTMIGDPDITYTMGKVTDKTGLYIEDDQMLFLKEGLRLIDTENMDFWNEVFDESSLKLEDGKYAWGTFDQVLNMGYMAVLTKYNMFADILEHKQSTQVLDLRGVSYPITYDYARRLSSYMKRSFTYGMYKLDYIPEDTNDADSDTE